MLRNTFLTVLDVISTYPALLRTCKHYLEVRNAVGCGAGLSPISRGRGGEGEGGSSRVPFSEMNMHYLFFRFAVEKSWNRSKCMYYYNEYSGSYPCCYHFVRYDVTFFHATLNTFYSHASPRILHCLFLCVFNSAAQQGAVTAGDGRSGHEGGTPTTITRTPPAIQKGDQQVHLTSSAAPFVVVAVVVICI